MANMEIKKELKKKKAKARKRKEIFKKVIPIAIVLAVLSLAIVLPITLSDGTNAEDNDGENNSPSVSTQYTILNLSSSNCPACNQLSPVISDIKSEYSGIISVKTYDVNFSAEGARIGNKYNVVSIPTLVFLKDDKEVSRTVGYRTKSQIESELRRLNWI